jgi:hypothetical protein
MRARLPGQLLAMFCTAAILGCSSQGPGLPQPAAPPSADALAARFAAGRALLDGFDAAEPEGQWRPGDRVLLGIAMDGAGQQKEWYLRVMAGPSAIKMNSGEVLTSQDRIRVRASGVPDSPWLVVEFDLVMMVVELFDGDGKEISSTVAMMPAICLRHGLTEFIEQEMAGQEFMVPGEELEKTAGGDLKATERQMRNIAGWLAVMKLPEFLNREDSMEGLLWQLIERPGLLSIVMNGGVSMALQMRGKDAVAQEPAPGLASPAFRVPMKVVINDATAMEYELVIARAAPPLGPCNGLVAIDAVNPKDPKKRVSVRLLAARRGGESKQVAR